MKYELRMQGGETLCCDSCNCSAPTADFDWGPPYNVPNRPQYRALCEFCSNTMASKHTERMASDQHGALRAEIWKSAASVFNMLKHGAS